MGEDCAFYQVTVPNFSTDRYPFGLAYRENMRVSTPKNNYIYNSKELQDGLKLYDYGARLYAPVIARWGVIDPMAEKYDAFSPYIYAANDPIYYIDPDGMGIIDYSWGTRYTGIDAQDKFCSLQMQYSPMQYSPMQDTYGVMLPEVKVFANRLPDL